MGKTKLRGIETIVRKLYSSRKDFVGIKKADKRN